MSLWKNLLGSMPAALLVGGLGCGASDAPAAPSSPSVATPSTMPSGSPGGPLLLGEPAPASGESPPAPSPGAPAPSAAGLDRCEGLVGGCGGWIGCVMVRADATTPGRFLGVGPDAGHAYSENHDCYAGVCNEICTGGSLSACRPGLTEVAGPIVCSAAIAPMVAPFTCSMVAGACVQGPDPAMIPAS